MPPSTAPASGPSLCGETAGVAGQPEQICQLAEAKGRHELDLALAGRIKAGGRIGRRLWASVFHLGASVYIHQEESAAPPQPVQSVTRRGPACQRAAGWAA